MALKLAGKRKSFSHQHLIIGQSCLVTVTSGLVAMLLALPAQAQTAQSAQSAQTAPPSMQPSIKVATRVVPPFVVEEDQRLLGFSIDLWHSLADEMGVQSEFLVKPDVAQLLAAVKSGQAEIGIAAVSITSDRYQTFDFSQPMFEAGLQIMVRDQAASHLSPPSILALLLSPPMLKIIGFMALIILIPAHVVWFFERRHPSGMLVNKAYFPGIFQTCWWAAATLATQADEMPKGVVARIMAVVWMFTSVVFVAYFTATVTTSLTVQQLQGTIRSPEDLPGKRVATTANSTSDTYLRQHHAQVLTFPRIEDAYDALLSGQADAVVFDAPVLLYYAAHAGKGKVHPVGNIFRRESYGIVFRPNSPYEKAVNEALLKIREKGIYQELYDKWFSNPSGN